MSNPILILAHDFAKNAHFSVNQVRKYTNEPYIVHPESVVRILSEVTDDVAILSAAYLHDVLEDVYTANQPEGYNIIKEQFGLEIADLVVELTDVYTSESFPNLNRNTRKAEERQRIRFISPKAKTIKLADLIDNTRDIVKYDANFAKIYMVEKRAMLEECLHEGNATLFQICQQQINDYFNHD